MTSSTAEDPARPPALADGLFADEAGCPRCSWCQATPLYRHYHDTEWGYPVDDDRRLFEKLCLEGFQSGLSWLTILNKREAFRAAFAHFDAERVARFGEADVVRLLGDAGIVRHRGKIEAAIQNAKSGKARIIAVAAPTRSPFLPDVPTVTEQGVKDIDLVSFLGWFGPKGMSPEVVKKLNAALAQAIAQPSVAEFFKTGAYTAESSTPEQLTREVKDAYEKWGALVKRAGIAKQ